MTRPSEPNLLERFLGADAASGGPLEILGLPRATLTDGDVLNARDRRIGELDDHPLAQTPEADEVRLAVHAAAANLLNPRVRASLVTGPGPVAAPNPATDAAGHRPPPKPAPPPNARSFERDALVTIGMHGGWGAQAQRRIAMLAHWHRLPPAAVTAALARLRIRPARRAAPIHRGRAQPGRPAGMATPITPESEQIDDVWRIAAGAGAALFFSAIILTVLVVVIVRSGSDDVRSGPPPRTTPEIVRRTQPGGPTPFIPEARQDLDAANVITHELRSAAAASLADHSDAFARFEAAAASLARDWPSFPPDAVRSANDSAADFMRSSDEACIGAIGVLEALGSVRDAGALTAALWADGVMALASSDPSLAHAARDRIAAYFDRLDVVPPSPTFAGGVEAGLGARLRSISPADETAWRAWASALNAAGLSDAERAEPLVISATEHLLRRPDEPSVQTLGRLVGLLSWRDDSEARAWLIGQFDAADVPTARLAALLAAIAESSSAPDVLPDMTLEPTATRSERTALRDRYARAWRLDADNGVPDELAAAVRQELAEAVQGSRISGNPADRMRALVRLARANAMAARLTAGDAQAVAEERLVGLARIEESDATSAAQTFDVNAPVAEDGQWGAQTLLIDAQDEEALLDAVTRIRDRENRLGPGDAGVLANLAFRGSGVTIRAEAARSLVRHAESPHVLLAILDMLDSSDSIPRNETNARVLESVTRRVVWTGEREDFYPNARAALLERILERIASDTAEARIDRLADLIARYYHWASTGESVDTDAPPASVSASLLKRKLRTGLAYDAATVFDEAPRRSLAQSRTERFLAAQWELLAAVASSAAERSPRDVPRINDAWDVLNRRDAAASELLDQIIAAERTLAVLWQLHLGGGEPG
ncbi:MAG: hypothetical protein RIB60_08785 [Phycisphaerales bacterium]